MKKQELLRRGVAFSATLALAATVMVPTAVPAFADEDAGEVESPAPTAEEAGTHKIKVVSDETSHGSFTVQVNGKEVNASEASADKDDIVKVTVTTDTWYESKLTYKLTDDEKSEAEDFTEAEYFEMPDGDVTIEVTIAPIKYKVKFDGNGGTPNKGMKDQPFTYDDDPQELTQNDFKREGYTFRVWKLTADGKGSTTFSDEEKVKNLTDEKEAEIEDGVITLYAQWTPVLPDKNTNNNNNSNSNNNGNSNNNSNNNSSNNSNNTNNNNSNNNNTNNNSNSNSNNNSSNSNTNNTNNTNNNSNSNLNGAVTSTTTIATRVSSPVPEVSNSHGGSFMSAGDTVTYTVTQRIPSDATYVSIWSDLEPVMSYVSTADSVVVRSNGVAIATAKVDISGQRITVTFDDVDAVSALHGRTVTFDFTAKLNDNADLSSYLNSLRTTASVPYSAHTEFRGSQTRTVDSSTEYVKIAVSGTGSSYSSGSSTSSGTSGTTGSTTRTASTGSSTSSSGSTTSSTASRSSRSGLAATADPTSFAGAAAMALSGLGLVSLGRVKRGASKKE